jgi:hypothetical protein
MWKNIWLLPVTTGTADISGAFRQSTTHFALARFDSGRRALIFIRPYIPISSAPGYRLE